MPDNFFDLIPNGPKKASKLVRVLATLWAALIMACVPAWQLTPFRWYMGGTWVHFELICPVMFGPANRKHAWKLRHVKLRLWLNTGVFRIRDEQEFARYLWENGRYVVSVVGRHKY